MGRNNKYNPDEALKLENQMCFPLYAAARKITGKYTPYLKPLGLTYTQYIVFLALWENDGLTVGELGQTLMLDNGTLTPMLKKMESAGYVRRVRSRKDERVVEIHLTDDGRKMKKRVCEIPLKVGQCVRLESEEVAELRAILGKLLAEE